MDNYGIVKTAIILFVLAAIILLGSLINARACTEYKCCANGTATMFPVCKTGACK